MAPAPCCPRLAFLAVVAGLLLMGAAGCTSFALRGADPAGLRSATVIEACPLGVPGSRVGLVDRPGMVEVHFTTRPSNIAELRLRVRDQARVNGPERHRGRGHLGDHEGARNHGLRLWSIGPLRTAIEDTASGALLRVEPTDPGRLPAVREALARRVAAIEAAGCF